MALAARHSVWARGIGRLRRLVRNDEIRSYERIYDAHARQHAAGEAVGDGDFDLIGRIELDLLQMEGLRPGMRLVDFGCGSGRLAVHVVPALGAGSYIGIDVSAELLRRGESLIRDRHPQSPCGVQWIKHVTCDFPLPDASVDMFCAFSVFTHLEHEDTYKYLCDARRVAKPGGKFVFSCLPMDHAAARDIFRTEADHDLATRWNRVRNVTTTQSMMDAIAGMAGWRVDHWYRGDEANIGQPGETLRGLGQASCVLVRPDDSR
ncbi:MAG: class I SAM-dependent methyltransferase [Gemmataceae bacterium]|nr:class I SAM-dependent methyltransferase [Gemmataceae bacterium]